MAGCNNIVFRPPVAGRELASELRDADLYVTGAVNESAGMHHIEAALCGLPILYVDSGATPEYCNGFGMIVDQNSIEAVLWDCLNESDRYGST